VAAPQPVLEGAAELRPVAGLRDRELQLNRGSGGDGRPGLGDDDPAQPFLLLPQRITKLDEAVVPELVSRDHAVVSIARGAAPIARSMSSTVPSVAWPATSPVAGLTMSKSAPLAVVSSFPSISIR